MKTKLMACVLAGVLLSGCTTYRVTSNVIDSPHPTPGNVRIMVYEDDSADHHYQRMGPIEVTVRKGNPFMASPTKRQAEAALVQKARDMGAEAVINATYESGFDLMSWGHIKAKGVCIRYTE